MNIKVCDLSEVRLYIGAQEGYDGRIYDENELVDAIQKFQKDQPEDHRMPVRVTATRYVHCGYQERGWEISCVNYPRYKKTFSMVNEFMNKMAEHLMVCFRQHRVSIAVPHENIIKMIQPDHFED